ncbi:Ubiquitin-conjugating enzyme E2 S [Intoshia linei]|uniref:ABC-type glutathione-S-conjugate transporter n=1 Tax=Intoshia linei TaxID=1819745 RepID=A0A177B0C2_9BILA|nr:Ubiquitin-conjugating enzyme E2 S [Intoshia linei]
MSQRLYSKLLRDITELHENPIQDIYITYDNLNKINAFIQGPEATPFEGGTFSVQIEFNDSYPEEPPAAFFLTKIFHPNIKEETGEVCVNSLKKDWNPNLGLSHILKVIRCLLIEPNPTSALNPVASRLLLDAYSQYDERARMITRIHAGGFINLIITEMSSSTIWLTGLCGNDSTSDAFWDSNYTFTAHPPDVTSCFRKTILVWFACGLLWIISPFYFTQLYYLQRVKVFPKLLSLNTFKQIIGSTLIVFILSIFVQHIHLYIHEKDAIKPVDILSVSLLIVSLCIANFLTWYEYQKGVTSSGEMFLFWTIYILVHVIFLRSIIIHKPTEHASIIFYCYFGFLTMRWIAECFADKSALKPLEKSISPDSIKSHCIPKKLYNYCDYDDNEKIKPCPSDVVHVISRICYSWILPLIVSGWRNPLTFEKLFLLRNVDTCQTLLKIFQRLFFTTKPKNFSTVTPRSKHSFTMCLVKAVAFPMIYGALLRFLWVIFCFISPILLGLIIEFIADKERDVWQGVFLAICLLVVNSLQCLFRNNYIQCDAIAGLRGRSVVNAVVFHKMMKLSTSSKYNMNSGDLINRMSVDAQKIQDAPMFFQLLWAVPVLSIISTIFLWYIIGPACFAGLGLLCIIIPFNGIFLTNLARIQQKKQMTQKDLRLSMLQELLNGVKVIKLYAWELIFRDKIESLRNKEIKLLHNACYINAISSVLWLLTPYFVSLVIFATFIFLSPDNILNAKIAFVTISLINVLNMPVLLLTQGIHFVAQAMVSLSRLEQFMNSEEIIKNEAEYVTDMKEVVKINNATFSWTLSDPPNLKKIDLSIHPNTLTAVVGSVGSGKTSLISAILGNMVKYCGTIHRNVNYKIALVSQEAWIQNNTVLNNIICSKPYDEQFYDKVIHACALINDLNLLVAGDETEIGEKGINLSGGQKQRISIARAIYQQKDLVLFDDPLSAVDVHVGKHIFDNVIANGGILSGKTRVLVTHSLSHLEYVDNIVVMDRGLISEQGTYDELISNKSKFFEMIKIFNKSEVSQEKKNEIATKAPLKVYKLTSDATIIKKETVQTGSINWYSIQNYLLSVGACSISVCLCFLFLYMLFHIGTSIWLSEWTDLYYIFNADKARKKSLNGLLLFGLLGLGQLISSFVMAIAIAIGCIKASNKIHKDAIDKLIHAPLTYFDTTPLGRITNRLSKDVDGMDTNLQFMIRWWLFVTSPMINTLILIIYSTPLFVTIAIPTLIIFFVSQRFYVVSVRQIKRIDNTCRSPIYSIFDECNHGITSLRAYGMQEEYIGKIHHLINQSQRPWFLLQVCQRFLGIFLENMMAFVIFFAAIFAVIDEDISPGLVGLSIGYSLQIALYAQNSVRSATEVETFLVSVERMDEFNYIQTEDNWNTHDQWILNDWPKNGTIEFIDYKCKYRPNLDYVLKEINLKIEGQTKIGVVGRTGSGKSSMVLAMFRILEASSGKILIDNIPISYIGLHDLRNNITIIPQDPIVFTFSLRENLDPFTMYTDDKIWSAIDAVNLKVFVENLNGKLEYFCKNGGSSFSVGQKQLICLARAILRNTKIIVLDEATAAVDVMTDCLIQQTLKKKFVTNTVITIAHRINTIIDYDKILVLDNGKVAEFDTPKNLIDKRGMFYEMASKAKLV